MADIKIAGTLHNSENIQGDPLHSHVVARADEILDEAKGKKQSVFNQEADTKLDTHETRLNGYTQGKFVTVTTREELVPGIAATDTIYRVSNYDGSANSGQGAVDVTKYSEYAWDGTRYVFLSVKTQIGEVFDISEYNAGAVYADLADALSNDHVPAGVRRPGMSVKFLTEVAPASYTVVKTEGLDDQPAGTELSVDPGVDSGTYDENQLGVFSTLPASTGAGNAVTYWMEVEGDPTTYTKWVITLVHTSDNNYVQFFCTANEFTTDVTQWQGVDEEPTAGSENLVKSGSIDYNIKKLSNKNIEPVLGYFIKKDGTVASSYNHIKTIVKAGDIAVFSGNNSNSSYCYTAALIPDDGSDTVVIVETGAASNFVYKVTTDGTLYVNFSNAYLATSYLKFTNPEYELINELYAESGNVTYDDGGNILSYPVKWSSGATGTYTNTDWDAANNMYKGYEITYSTLMKLVQPAVTVSNGKITNIPNKTIIEL